MKILLNILSLFLLASCNKTSTITTDVTTEYDKTHSVKVNLLYAEPINGYTVTATCFVDTTSNYDSPNTNCNRNAIVGRAYIHFKNDTAQFTLENPLFSDYTLMANPTPLKAGININATYTAFSPNTSSDNMIFNGNQSPFFFYDIDFDGEKELIITLWEGMEYHAHHAYEVYKVSDIKNGTILHSLTTPPFDRINDYSLIDSIAKTISICKGIDAMKIVGYDTYQIRK